MTVRKFVLPMFFMSLITTGCEDKKPAEAEVATGGVSNREVAKVATAPEPVAAPAAAPAEAVAVPKEAALPGPAEICGGLIEAARAKDDSKLLAISTPATATAIAADGVKDHLMGTFAGASCGTAKIEGDSATVPLNNTEPAQEATFSKAADGWKFDGAAFLAKYPVKVVKEKAKKAAATVKAHAKPAAHGKKHH